MGLQHVDETVITKTSVKMTKRSFECAMKAVPITFINYMWLLIQPGLSLKTSNLNSTFQHLHVAMDLLLYSKLIRVVY